MSKPFDPYYKWLGIPPRDQPPHHYRLLGIEVFESDRDVIDAAANRVMAYLKELAIGDHAEDSQRLLNEIAQARICLLNPSKKREYDEKLKRKLAEPTPPLAPEAKSPSSKSKPPSLPPKHTASPPSQPPVPPKPAELPLAAPLPTIAGNPALPPPVPPVVAVSAEPPRAPSTPPPSNARSRVPRAGAAVVPAVKSSADPLKSLDVKPARRRPRWLYPAIAITTPIAILAVVLALLQPGGEQEPSHSSNGDSTSERDSKAKTKPGRAKLSTLRIALTPADSGEISRFEIDDQPQPLPPQTETTLSPGLHHILLVRDGYEPIDVRVVMVGGLIRELKPRWHPAGTAPARGLPHSNLDFDASTTGGLSSGFGEQVAHWPFDDNLMDVSGEGRQLQITGSPNFITGRIRGAIAIPAGQSLRTDQPLFSTSSEATVAFWIRRLQSVADDRPVLDGADVQLYLRQGHPLVMIAGHQSTSGPLTDPKSGCFQGIDLTQDTEEWKHFAFVYSRVAGQVHFYLNGQHVGFQTYRRPAPVAMPQMVLDNVIAEVDDLRVFNYRLSTADIQAINAQTFAPPPQAPPSPNGRVVCETWIGPLPGKLRRQLEAVMLREPDETSVMSRDISFQYDSSGEERLHRIRGFLYPPQDGDYLFTVSGSGDTSFYLQRRDPDKETLQLVTASRMRGRGVSEPISLKAGQNYYFEVLQTCSGDGPDLLRLGGKLPGLVLPRLAMPTKYVASFEEAHE